MMKQVIIAPMLLIMLSACLVSRTERPRITGYVYDHETRIPLEGCKVAEAYTDSLGFFQLKERRYWEFAFPGGEAPPVMIYELVEKENYKTDTIRAFNRYGGGARKGVHWEMDTIFLKENSIYPDTLGK